MLSDTVNNMDTLQELFDNITYITNNVNNELKNYKKKSLNSCFYFKSPKYPSTANDYEKKLINKNGIIVTKFFNKNKKLLLDCIYTGNYNPISVVLPSNVEFSILTDDGIMLYTNTIPKPLIQSLLLSVTDFYSINLYEYSFLSNNNYNINSDLSFCFKILSKYNVSLPSSIAETLLSNIICVYKIINPIVPLC